MPDTQVLNLDDLTQDRKTVKLDNISHEQEEMTVEGYIARVKRARELPETEDRDVQTERTIVFLHEMYPTLSMERLAKLTLKQLSKLIEYSLATPEDIANAATTANAANPQAASGNG